MTAAKKRNVVLGLSAVVVSVQDDTPKIFVVRGAEHGLSRGVLPVNEEGDALPFGPFDPETHPTLELGLRGWIKTQTPLRPGYVEQLYTFGDHGRYMGQDSHAARVISVGYLALTRPGEMRATERTFWGDWYGYFPWEDRRAGDSPQSVRDTIALGLNRWVSEGGSAAEKKHRRLRADMCFGLNGAVWDEEKVLERYELLYEARLVYESIRDGAIKVDYALVPGRSMLFDHRRILATAMSRLRGKLKYRPVVFELMPEEFTLLQLQKTVEAITGQRLHKQNFRRLVEGAGMVEEIPRKASSGGGRPAALFRFRQDVTLERPSP